MQLGLGMGIAAPMMWSPVALGGLLSVQLVDSTPIDPQGGIGVDGAGWVAKVTIKGISNTALVIDPTKLTLSVTDPGYDTSGTATTVSRTITGVAHMRRTFPNGNSKMASTDGTNTTFYVTLDDWVYSGTTIVSAALASGFCTGSLEGNSWQITNSSNLPYPKPIFGWINPQSERAGSTHAVEALAFHRHARNQQQVACIKFQASDGTTSSPVVTTGTTALSLRQTRGNIAEVWKATLDMSTLAQATMCNVNAQVYPWIGNASAVLDLAADGAAWPTAIPCTRLRVFNDRTGGYGGAFAYVKAGASAGTVSANAATAAADPYPTVTAAMNAVKTWNNANKGHNDHGGATIRLMDNAGAAQNHSIASTPTTSSPATHYVVEKDPAATGAVSITFTVQSTFPDTGYWRNLIHTTGALTYNWLGADVAGSQIVVDGCTVDNTAARQIIAQYNYKYLLNINHIGGTGTYNSAPGTAGAIASNIGMTSTLRVSAGTKVALHVGCATPDDIAGSSISALYRNDGRILYNNTFSHIVIDSSGIGAHTNLYGAAVVQNRVENWDGGLTLNLFADGDLTTITNLVDMHNTGAGERCSRMYNDAVGVKTAPAGLIKRGTSRYNIWDNYNCKSDYFAAGNGVGSVGNWSYTYSVGNAGNVSLFGNVTRLATQLPTNDATDNYLGNAWLQSSEYNLFRTALGFTQAQIMALFTNYTVAPKASPAAGGNYQPLSTASYLKSRVPAGLAVLRYDLAGNARLNNGVGAAGAYEAAP